MSYTCDQQLTTVFFQSKDDKQYQPVSDDRNK